MAHTFEFDGVTVEYYPAVVKTRLKRGRIIAKLMAAYHYVHESPRADETIISDADWDSFLEYAGHLAQSCATGAAWWVDENASTADLQTGYEAFLETDGALFDALRMARRAVEPPKKTP